MAVWYACVTLREATRQAERMEDVCEADIVALRRWCLPGMVLGFANGIERMGIPRLNSALAVMMFSIRSSCCGAMASGSAAATRKDGESDLCSSPQGRSGRLLDEYASQVCSKNLLKSMSVPIPSMMLCGARRTRPRRILSGAVLFSMASGVLRMNIVGSRGTGGSALHQSRLVRLVEMGRNVVASHSCKFVVRSHSETAVS